MIVCKTCGFRNQEGTSFCTSCGSFLEWTGERVSEPESTSGPAAGPGTDSQPEGLLVEDDSAGSRLAPSYLAGELGGPASAPPITAAGGSLTALMPEVESAPAVGTVTEPADDRAEPGQTETLVEPVTEGAPSTLVPTPPAQVGDSELVAPVDAETGGPAADTFAEAEPSEAAANGAVAPSALKPQRVSRRPVRRAGENGGAVRLERKTLASGIICSVCGITNEVQRYFCHHCGNVLPPPPPPPPPLSRWQRIKRRARIIFERTFYLKPRQAQAGERVGRHWRSQGADASNETVRTRLVTVAQRALGLVVVVGLLLAYLGPLRNPINSEITRLKAAVSNRLALKYVAIYPVSATATSSLAGFPPTNAIDGLSTTYWAAKPTANSGVGQSITFTLSPATRLDKIGFIIGANDTAADYTSQPRPAKVTLSFNNGKSVTYTLVDSSTFQSFTLLRNNVSRVTVTVKSVYLSPIGKSVSIAEVLFYRLQ